MLQNVSKNYFNFNRVEEQCIPCAFSFHAPQKWNLCAPAALDEQRYFEIISDADGIRNSRRLGSDGIGIVPHYVAE